jgi:hypothetical protein
MQRNAHSLPHRSQKAFPLINLKAHHIPSLLRVAIPANRNRRQDIVERLSALLIIEQCRLRLLSRADLHFELVHRPVVRMLAPHAFGNLPVGGLQEAAVLA